MFFEDLKPEREVIFQKRVEFDEEHDLHMHDWLEINVLLENRAGYKLLNREYTGEPGDVFIFRPYEPHYNLVKDPQKPITWILVLFSPSVVRLIPYGYRLLFPFYTETASPHILKTTSYAAGIHAAAIGAVEEQKAKRPGWEAKQFMYFIDILLHIYRYTLDQSASSEGADVDPGLITVMEHILQHITEDLDTAELIRIYGKGKTCFYTNFKRTVGVTPNDFIHRMRMQIAMYLLDTTDKSVTDIAFECGYNSIHYFNKHFKSYRDVSPREYRNRVRKRLKGQ